MLVCEQSLVVDPYALFHVTDFEVNQKDFYFIIYFYN